MSRWALTELKQVVVDEEDGALRVRRHLSCVLRYFTQIPSQRLSDRCKADKRAHKWIRTMSGGVWILFTRTLEPPEAAPDSREAHQQMLASFSPERFVKETLPGLFCRQGGVPF